MTWYIIAAAVVVLFTVVALAAGTGMFFNYAILSDNYKKGRRPTNAWDEDENRPEDVMFNASCIPYKDEMIEVRKWIKRCELKEFTVTSYDGLKLKARFLAPQKMRGIVLMMNGYRSNPLHDFSLAVKEFYEMGVGCMLPYQRAHGDSEGKYICFGVKERYDVVSWCELIGKEFPGVPVILDGISMGATRVMMASGLDLPPNVKGIIADCGFTSPFDIFKSVASRFMHLRPFPFIYLTGIAARLRAGFSLKQVYTQEELKKNRLPIFIAHGKKDNFVPYSMSEINYAAAKEVCDATFLSAPEADHGMSFLTERGKYLKEVQSMVDRCMPA